MPPPTVIEFIDKLLKWINSEEVVICQIVGPQFGADGIIAANPKKVIEFFLSGEGKFLFGAQGKGQVIKNKGRGIRGYLDHGSVGLGVNGTEGSDSASFDVIPSLGKEGKRLVFLYRLNKQDRVLPE